MIDCLVVPYNVDYYKSDIPSIIYDRQMKDLDLDSVFDCLDNVNISIFHLDDYENMEFNQIIEPLKDYVKAKKPRLILGFNHGLSYPSIIGLDPKNIVLVDSHDDTYDKPEIKYLANTNWAKKLLMENNRSRWLWVHTFHISEWNTTPPLLSYDNVVDFVRFYNSEFNNCRNDDIPRDMVDEALTRFISKNRWLEDEPFYLTVCSDGVRDFSHFANYAEAPDFYFENLKTLIRLGPETMDLMEFGRAFTMKEWTEQILSYLQEIINLLDAHPPASKPLLKLQQNI